MASMVCDCKIEIPMHYVSTTFQVRRKRGHSAVENAEVVDAAEEQRTNLKVHYAARGYAVPPVTLRMETVDSDEDFEWLPP